MCAIDTLFVTIFLFRSRNADVDLHMHPLWKNCQLWSSEGCYNHETLSVSATFFRLPFTVYFFLRRLISEIFACSWNQEKFRKFCDGKHFGSHICWHLIIGCSLISGCPSIIPGASAGVIYSPNFPWSYPLSRSCEWRIRAPWGQRVHLKFIKFNLETSSFSCEFDYVEVLDKYNTQLGKYCGSDIPSSISSSSSLTVKFNSDYSNTFSGFLLLYQTGYSFPTGAPVWTTYRPYTSTTVQYHSCSSYSSETSKFISFL